MVKELFAISEDGLAISENVKRLRCWNALNNGTGVD